MEWTFPEIALVLMSEEDIEKQEMTYRKSRMSDDVKKIAEDIQRRYGRF